MEHRKMLFGRKTNRTPAPSGMITTMFTDILSSTQLKALVAGETSARRDAAFRAEIKEPHDAVVLSYTQEADGYVVNSTGDGYCVTFVDAEEALLCALRIQERLRSHPIVTPLGTLQVRIGLHTGMVGSAGGGYTAATLDKTAWVQRHAEGGQVFISRETHALVAGKLQGIAFENAGTFEMKGLDAEGLFRVTLISRSLPESMSRNHLSYKRSSRSRNLLSQNLLSQNYLREKQDKRRSLPWPAAVIGILLLGGLGYFMWNAYRLQTRLVLPIGSRWSGSFRFLPPIQNYGGSASLTVTERSGEKFQGVYATEGDSYEWRVDGTVQGSDLRWEFAQALKNPGKEDAVGKAYVEGTVEGNQFTGRFHDYNSPDEVAALQMRRDK